MITDAEQSRASLDSPDIAKEPPVATLFRRRGKLIVSLGLIGFAGGLAIGLLSPREYVSSAMFIPTSQEAGASGLQLAASQFGIQLPAQQQGWGAPLYVELLNSRMLLEPIVVDTLMVPEEGRRVAVMELLHTPDLPAPQRRDRAIRLLRERIAPVEDKKLNAVRLSVKTRWPSVSHAIATRLVDAVNQFNLATHKSQATAERQFVEQQAAAADTALRIAENQMQAFLQRNRSIAGSPELTLEQDRLQRAVILRQTILTTLLQRREEARVKEVRDTPVITVVESPQLPVTGEPRRSAMKAIIGSLIAAGFGLVLALTLEALSADRRRFPGASMRWLRVLRTVARDPFGSLT